MRRAIVIGCGNLLRGDDGLGIAAVRLLQERLRTEGDSARWPGWRLEQRPAGQETVARGLVPLPDPAPAARKGPRHGLPRHRLTGVLDLVEAGGPGLALLDLFAGAEVALIIDAIVAGALPGTIHRCDGAVMASAAAHGQRHSGALSAHDCDLATVLALGRALFPEQWPGTVAIWGIEPASVRLGEGLSAPVAAALPALVARIHGELEASLTISSSVAEAPSKPVT